MEILILDTTLEAIGVIDSFESLIWTDRYGEYGDFELYTSSDSKTLSLVKHDYYLWIRDSDRLMIVEDIKIKSDFENGNKISVTGRSLESILDRRIVWAETSITGNLQNGVKKLLDENIIIPTNLDRKINNFVFLESTDPIITALTLEAQFIGQNLYDVIKNICEINKIGFKITLAANNNFVFQLYAGIDRSYSQILNPYVIFSPEFENIINSNYLESKKTLKTVILVTGEDPIEGQTRKSVTVNVDTPTTNLERREMFNAANDILKVVGETTLTDAEYEAQLTFRGKEELTNNKMTKTFEGKVETIHSFKIGEDFFLGDIVQVINEYGIESKSRITEVVLSKTIFAEELYPTFTNID